MVKAFVIRTENYKTKDEGELRKELQEHVKSITAPYKYPRKVGIFINLLSSSCFHEIEKKRKKNNNRILGMLYINNK